MGTPLQRKRPIRVLSASTDPGLNHARAMLLRDHGFDVHTSDSVEAAIGAIERDAFDVLIFGSTLPSDACWKLAHVFRQHSSKGRIIEILPSPWAAPRNRPDATVVGADEPSRLVTLIQDQVLQSSEGEQ